MGLRPRAPCSELKVASARSEIFADVQKASVASRRSENEEIGRRDHGRRGRAFAADRSGIPGSGAPASGQAASSQFGQSARAKRRARDGRAFAAVHLDGWRHVHANTTRGSHQRVGRRVPPPLHLSTAQGSSPSHPPSFPPGGLASRFRLPASLMIESVDGRHSRGNTPELVQYCGPPPRLS